jgi:hypothetical protein
MVHATYGFAERMISSYPITKLIVSFFSNRHMIDVTIM